MSRTLEDWIRMFSPLKSSRLPQGLARARLLEAVVPKDNQKSPLLTSFFSRTLSDRTFH